jgi:hypothetical protein
LEHHDETCCDHCRRQEIDPDKAKVIMQVKLDHAQKLLEGLAVEDFDNLTRNSNALTLLSMDTDWNIIQTSEYRRLSEEFRRSTKALTKSAQDRNLDGALLSYVGLTMKCVECHTYVRGLSTE